MFLKKYIRVLADFLRFMICIQMHLKDKVVEMRGEWGELH